GEALQEVERHALAGEERACRSAHAHHGLAWTNTVAIGGDDVDLAARLEAEEYGGGQGRARDDTVGLGDDGGVGASARRDSPARGPVTRAAILLEREINEVQCGVIDGETGWQSRCR